MTIIDSSNYPKRAVTKVDEPVRLFGNVSARPLTMECGHVAYLKMGFTIPEKAACRDCHIAETLRRAAPQ